MRQTAIRLPSLHPHYHEGGGEEIKKKKNLPASLGNWFVSVGSQLITLKWPEVSAASWQSPSTSPEAHPNLGEKAKG